MAVFASRGLLPTASNATAIISDARMARAAAKCSRLCAAKKSATMTRTPAGRADRRREDHVCEGTRRALQMSRTAPVRVRNGRVLLAMGGTIAAPLPGSSPGRLRRSAVAEASNGAAKELAQQPIGPRIVLDQDSTGC